MSPLALGALLAALCCACDDGETGGGAPSSETLAAVPNRCREVAEHFGYTLQAGADADLMTLLHEIYVRQRTTTRGALDVRNACESPACDPTPYDEVSTFERCLVAVEQALLGIPNLELSCGDGICQVFEAASTNYDEDTGQWTSSCPEDCSCGNGVCEAHRQENEVTCELDCPPVCGDDRCNWQEQCGEPPAGRPWMGRCDRDCCGVDFQAAVCGDGFCAAHAPYEGAPLLETADSCEEDCGAQRCGDGICLPPETSDECAADCGMVACGVEPSTTFVSCAGGANCLNCPDGCADPLEVCGDGVCSGCEPWSCRLDCAGASLDGCGDGTCAGGLENPLTCPRDCAFDPTLECVPSGNGTDCTDRTVCGDGLCTDLDRYRRCTADCGSAPTVCGDGYCEAGESGSGLADPGAWTVCEADCADTVTCPSDPLHPECLARGSRCILVESSGPVTGTPLLQWAAFDCATCELTLCADECTTVGGAAQCIECSQLVTDMPPDDTDQRCGEDRAPRCVDANRLSFCESDPGAPSQPGCDLRTVEFCPNGCANGQCVPCDGDESCPNPGELCSATTGRCTAPCGDGLCSEGERCPGDCDHQSNCGDGLCMTYESVESCPQDCTCGSACNVFIYNAQGELWCPSGFAACFCNGDRCNEWEREGPWQCASDCP